MRLSPAKSLSYVLSAYLLSAGLGVPIAANGQSVVGKTVYDQTCAVCHGTGAANAPKFGDKKVWAPLLKEPQWQLTAHGYVGVRAMPPKGGNPSLSVEDFAKAVVYMANAAGSKWTDPDAKLIAQINKEIVKREAQMKTKAKP